MIILYKFLYAWLLPPAIFLPLLFCLAWQIWKKSKRVAGFTCMVAGLIYLSSIQPVSELLLRPLEYKYPLPQAVKADVIVLLGGGLVADAPFPQGLSGQMADAPTQRLLAAYAVHRRYGWPIVISGGEVLPGYGVEAAVMRDVLISLGMEPGKIIVETKSLNTQQNAQLSAAILRQRGHKQPILVTSAFHMLRAVEEFRRVGVEVIPYPVGFYASRNDYWTILSWVPSAAALHGTGMALKEYLGLVVLQLR